MNPLARFTQMPRRPTRADLLVAGGLLVWTVFEAFRYEGPGPLGARVVYAILIAAPLALRRQWPLGVTGVVLAVTMAWAMHKGAVHEHGTIPFPSLMVAAFSVSCYARQRKAAALAGVLLFAVAVYHLAINWFPGSHNADFGGLAILFLFFAGAWGAGSLVRQRAAEARRAVAESGALAQLAVAEERTRIARELHDVVAHSVSIMAVQAGAAEEQIDLDPERAREHIAQVRRTAREAMTEMRRVLDVLRTDEPRFAPQPGLARLSDLIDETRSAGVSLELIEQGKRPQLPAGLDLVVFRVVQESLTNVRKHAAGTPAQVRLQYAREHVEVEVANGPGGVHGAVNGVPRGGHGLIGMRERVHLFGGRLQVGPTPDGGFRVLAILPLSEEPA